MYTKFMIIPFVAATTFSFSALASSVPPANSMALSDVLQSVERQFSPTYIDEVNWDDDGYWEVEYVDQYGSKREIKIDPITGDVRK
ncbi:PepSY domain-containing protein [Sneathiella marina]|uniref:PepSY domain-containing protein n=1 Tax=Sneathiella marina TaxID=2950108 RepID=A0ABY4W497_9PROT|nr:PepSY domain-containing protein [Sneathiella marina]USG61863.1 PepSY domain-containing protein [Sneathiella marina]